MSRPIHSPAIRKKKPFLNDANFSVQSNEDDLGRIVGFTVTIKRSNVTKEFKVLNYQILDAWIKLEKFIDGEIKKLR